MTKSAFDFEGKEEELDAQAHELLFLCNDDVNANGFCNELKKN